MLGRQYRSALVTGASSGIGKAVTEALCARGMTVHALALPDTGLEAVCAATGAVAHALDVTDTTAVEHLIGGLEIDVLVNNAGVLGAFKPIQHYSREDADRLIAVNLAQAIHCTRVALPGMIARRRGHIVFLGSIAGRIAGGGYAVYGATKAGILAFSEALRWDLLGTGLRSTVIVPGRVETHIYDQHFGDHAAAHKALYEGLRAIQPADIARVLLSALDMPAHVDVTIMEVMPTQQVFGGSKIGN